MSASQLIELTIDGRKVSVPAGTTIFDAARANNIEIPALCNQQNEAPVGVCRVCVVDVGARVYAASCIRPVEPGMVVNTASDGVKRARHTLVELLMSDHASPCARERQSGDCELEALAKSENITRSRYAPRPTRRGPDNSSMSIAVDFDACILCDRCVRGCNDIRENFVLGRMGKGASTGIAFDNNEPMGESSCVSCGECMVSCPTGALTNRLVTQTEIAVTPDSTPVPLHELQELPFFGGVSGTFLSLNRNAVVRRHFKPGEIICREGEYGSTAFYLLEGQARVSIASPIAHVKTKGAVRKFLGKLSSRLTQRQNDQREEETTQHWIHIDAPMDLNYDNPVAMLGPGDLFGEMTCMSLYPRSATIRAETDCTALEMLRNVLDIMQRNKTFRAKLDQSYRERALDSHLRAVPVFAELTDEFIEDLREKVELLRFTPGSGDLPAGRSRGQLLPGAHRFREGIANTSGRRNGAGLSFARRDTSVKPDLLDAHRCGPQRAPPSITWKVVRVSAEDFASMTLEHFPGVRGKLEECRARTGDDERRAASGD